MPAAQITIWKDTDVCGRVELDGLFDGVVWVETAAGARSQVIPFMAPARDVVFRLPGDRPLVTGDVIGIEGENLGTRGHVVIGGLVQGVTDERIDVQLDAAFGGEILFRKIPGSMLWSKDITVFPTQLAGAVAGPNELGGVSGHIGAGAIKWTLNGEPLPGGPTGRWFDAVQTIGEHVLKAEFIGRETEVTVARVPWDTHHLGPLQPDGIALPPHRQQTAVIGGLAYSLFRASAWRLVGGGVGMMAPGIPEVGAYASAWRTGGEGPFIPGQAFDREARFGLPDEDYDRSGDMPRIIADPHEDAVGYQLARAVDYSIEPDLQGAPTVTRTRAVVPLTARLFRHAPVEEAGRALETTELRSVVIPNGAADGRMAGLGRAGAVLWVALTGNDETWFVGGDPSPEAAWATLGMVEGAWEAFPAGDGIVLLQTGDGDGPVALRRVQVVAGENENPPALAVGEPISMALHGVDVARVMAWRAEDDGGLLLALRMADASEVIAVLPPELDEVQTIATLPASWPGIGATRTTGAHLARHGVADVVRHRGAIFLALTGAGDDAQKGLWVARVDDGAMTREMASVEVDRVRCLGPYPWKAGVCGTPGLIEANTQGCTYFACPKLDRMWMPQTGGEVEQARLAVDSEGLKVHYAVRFPPGWSVHELDVGRLRTAVFRVEPFRD
jgi:hypothetical protein